MTTTRTAHRLITCVMPAGRGLELIEQLRELGVTSAQVHHARGVGQSSKRRRGVSLYAEREVVQALVAAARADEVFEFLYAAAEIGRPHAGMLFMEKVAHGIPLVLPDLPDEI
jgi:nitrogen regulatory protein PII